MEHSSDLDRVLDVLNRLILKTQKVALLAKQGHSLLLKAAVAILYELKQIANKFFKTNGQNFVDVLHNIERLDAIVHKLFLKLENFSIFLERESTDDEERNLIQAHIPHKEGLHAQILLSICKSVREFERSFIFQRQLWFDRETLSRRLNCSLEQFSYGTSSFDLFAKVFEHKSFRKHIQAVRPKVVVFGSSHGLLCFFIALSFPNSECFGFEVLESLHEKSVAFASEYKIGELINLTALNNNHIC
jgi:hypothetical protein